MKYNWREFLAQVSDDLLNRATKDDLEFLSYSKSYEKTTSARWFGGNPVSPAEIESLEKRLGLGLPKSYREFLLTTNGWEAFLEFPYGIVSLLSVSVVDWFHKFDECVGRLDSYIGP